MTEKQWLNEVFFSVLADVICDIIIITMLDSFYEYTYTIGIRICMYEPKHNSYW